MALAPKKNMTFEVGAEIQVEGVDYKVVTMNYIIVTPNTGKFAKLELYLMRVEK